MKHRVGRAGFTIVETMVVLAVIGLLFVLIAGTLSGRQRQSEFTVAINDARAQIQQVIDQIQNGYYAHGNNFTCNVSGGAVTFSGGGEDLGQNGKCVFLGNVLHFQQGDPARAQVYSVAGSRTATSLSTANPTVVPLAYSDEEIKLQYGLGVAKMRYGGGTGTQALAILASPLDATADVDSGNFQVDVYGMPLSSVAPVSEASVNTALNSISKSTVEICFKSGGTDQFGLVTIGQNNRQLSTELQITTQTDCGI